MPVKLENLGPSEWWDGLREYLITNLKRHDAAKWSITLRPITPAEREYVEGPDECILAIPSGTKDAIFMLQTENVRLWTPAEYGEELLLGLSAFRRELASELKAKKTGDV
ncbi:MAG TPA: hypothetical protein VGR35_01285 [Tepidisphaeraceae bacterium]|nr:hypothetical protein [Tepidisphaeraceae bacterium]